MSKENTKLKKLIEKGSEIGGNVSGAVIGLAIAGPVGAIGGALVSPILTEVYRKVGNEISERLNSNREEMRVGATYSLAYSKIENKIKEGEVPRNDDFMNPSNSDRSGAESILEGTLLKARSEYEEKKIKFYANFLANMNFNSTISFEKGNTLLRIIEQLSYRQFTIMAYLNKTGVLNSNRWMESFHDENNIEISEYQDFYSELLDLYNHQLLKQAGAAIGMSISSFKLSHLGNEVCQLLELDNVDSEDLEKIKSVVHKINHYKKR